MFSTNLRRRDPEIAIHEGTGYMYVHKTSDGQYMTDGAQYTSPYFRPKYIATFPLNTWVTHPAPNPNNRYMNRGFPIALSELRTSMGHLIKVQFRQVLTTQTIHPECYYGKIVVAREVYNLGEVTNA